MYLVKLLNLNQSNGSPAVSWYSLDNHYCIITTLPRLPNGHFSHTKYDCNQKLALKKGTKKFSIFVLSTTTRETKTKIRLIFHFFFSTEKRERERESWACVTYNTQFLIKLFSDNDHFQLMASAKFFLLRHSYYSSASFCFFQTSLRMVSSTLLYRMAYSLLQLQVKAENTHLLRKGKYHCTPDLQFDCFGLDQTNKYVSNST